MLADLSDATSEMLRRASNAPGVGALRSAAIQAVALNPDEFSDVVDLITLLAPEKANIIKILEFKQSTSHQNDTLCSIIDATLFNGGPLFSMKFCLVIIRQLMENLLHIS